jgi:hypothetical protein
MRGKLQWAAILIAMASVDLLCFAMAESTNTPEPLPWYVAAFSASGALALIGAAMTLRTRGWSDAVRFALLVAVVVAGTLYSVASVSTSRDCANQGQPASAGTYDCDTSNALGGALMVFAFFAPAFALVAVGRTGGRLVQRVSTRRPRG